MRNNLPPTEWARQGAGQSGDLTRVDGLRLLALELKTGAAAGRRLGSYRAAVPSAYSFASGFEPLLAVDSHGLLHLLLPADSVRSVREDHDSLGVILTARELVAGNSALVPYADLECRSAELADTYLLLADEVLARLQGDGQVLRPDVVAREALSRWRELLTKADSDRLSTNALAGLFGELTFIQESSQPSVLLKAWGGPDRLRHDFASGAAAAEIKTTLSADSERIVLHGLSQLDPPPDGQLFLVRYRLERSPEGLSVPDRIRQICARGVSPLELFTRLLRAGYSQDESGYYTTVRFAMRRRDVWRVDEHFPRLTPHSFVGDAVPPGIQILQYELDLSGAHSWKCEYGQLQVAFGGA